jgi:hypothetical protein
MDMLPATKVEHRMRFHLISSNPTLVTTCSERGAITVDRRAL